MRILGPAPSADPVQVLRQAAAKAGRREAGIIKIKQLTAAPGLIKYSAKSKAGV